MTVNSRLSVMTPMIEDATEGKVLQIVQSRVKQLVLCDHFTLLDLTKVKLRPKDLQVVLKGLQTATTCEKILAC